MTPVAIVGAGGLTREVLALLRAASRPAPVAVLDDDPVRWGSELAGVPVIGGPDLLARHPDWSVLLGIGQGRARRELWTRLTDLGVGEDRYATVVHPQVLIPPGCRVGAGSILLAGVVLTADVVVGRDVVVMPNAVLTHDVVVADHATVCAGVALAGAVTIGEAAYLGTNASVRERVRVGATATLGMGSVLLADLPDGQTWVGNPARPLTTRPQAATAPGLGPTEPPSIPRRAS